MSRVLDLALAILNGAIGDYLAKTDNGLATPMGLRLGGAEVGRGSLALAQAYPDATERLVVLVHGLMCDESCWRMPDGEDYGALLRRDLALTPLYVRFNSGRAVQENGADLSDLLRDVVAAWPVPVKEVVFVGYSMGGLMVRSACGLARDRGESWLSHVQRAIYLGTPHQGAPMERGGVWITRVLGTLQDPYTRLVGQIGDLRSQGVKDLGNASPVPLIPELNHTLIAGSLWAHPALASLFGDAIVPLLSATDGACVDLSPTLPPSHVKLFPGVSHVRLACDPKVYAELRRRCEE